MKVISFNVNGIRARLHQLEAVLRQMQPDVLGLQEIKVADADFPLEAVAALGYEVYYHGQKGHYGVALLSKQPAKDIRKGFPGDSEDAQRRMIAGCFEVQGQEVWVLNGYFPQGESRDHPIKFPAKERFYQDLMGYLETDFDRQTPLVIMGDFNIAPVDNDIGIGEANAKRWLRTGKTSFLPEERAWFQRLTDWGLKDSFRALHAEIDNRFSWFDYRSRGFEADPKRGLRIDHILVTEPLAACCVGAGIDYEIRGMEKPSDHCPVWAEFEL